MKSSTHLPLALSVLFALGVVACNSLGTKEDQSDAGTLWGQLQGYQSWGGFEGAEGMQKGTSVHGNFVRTFLNDVGAQDQANPAYGTIVVKENIGKTDLGSLESLTVMQRREGYDPDNNDWFWARYKPSGELTDSGKVEFCSDCHFDADNDDFLFLND